MTVSYLRPHRVAVLAVPGGGVFELAAVVEVFGLERPEVEAWNYELRVCSESPGPVRSSAGLLITAPHGLRALSRADTIIVPARGAGAPDPGTVAALRRAHARGARLVSICSGAFLLAAAGVLDGRRATTHWRYAGELARRHPEVDVDPGVLYVGDDRVLTAAGSAAAIDVCLELVRRDLGAAVANQVARRLVIAPHRDGGQAQFVELPVPSDPDDDRVAAVMQWALERLAEPLTVDGLARRAFMSSRTFTRHFRAATGTSPARWLLEQRVRASLPLLEASDEPIEAIAARVGFGSPGTYRQRFGALMRTSPSGYRRAFRETAAA